MVACKALLAILVAVTACSGQDTASTTVATDLSTIAASTTSTSTTTTTTTTTLPTTTTTPTASIDVEVAVYDDFISDSLEIGAPCEAGATFSFVVPNTGAILRDPNTQETLAVARLDNGQLEHELGLQSDLPPAESDLFWYCSFTALFSDVPLDRSFYEFIVEGDTIISAGLTFDGDEFRRNRFVGSSYFLTDSENTRANNR